MYNQDSYNYTGKLLAWWMLHKIKMYLKYGYVQIDKTRMILLAMI